MRQWCPLTLEDAMLGAEGWQCLEACGNAFLYLKECDEVIRMVQVSINWQRLVATDIQKDTDSVLSPLPPSRVAISTLLSLHNTKWVGERSRTARV